ncbi:hypothetical protein AUW26_30875 [Streptomyces sp. CC71]|nr:hypothetical protein AUW26_30875 [Streptomyces sp. CC71]
MGLERSRRGSMPARSIVSQVVSSRSRCCGSMETASRGETPKKPASKSATPSRKPPCWLTEWPRASTPASRRASRSQPRSVGKPETASVPEETRSHRSSGELTPPG